MPSARKKCICQICTCGRHICPHRKKSQITIGCEQHSGKSVKVTSREEKLKQRKQWETRTEQQSISLTTDQLNAQSLLASSENFASSVTVADTGNRNGATMRTEASNWSAKQIPKTLPIKRPDNLKAEGQAEFTTTHQRDFTKKSSELHIKESSHTSSEMVQAESWNKKQIPKTQKIKKEDTLMLTGPLESETTHKASYNESTFKSNAQHSEQSESYKRPRTSLKMSGEFQSDSSYQEAFTAKQASDTYKVKKGESKSNLKLEGEMSFERTSTDYNAASSQISAEDITTIKAKKIRPDSEIKIPAVPISDETTLANDFKRWNVERPVIHKPKDTLTLGDSDATDLNTTFIIEKSSATAENSKMETSISDYKNWEVTRPVVHKPENNLKSEGSFSFETTTDADYSSRRSMANKTINVEALAERTETESIAQSVQEERTSVSIAKSEGDKRSVDNGQIIETTEVMNRQKSNGAVESNAVSVHESSAISVHESSAVSVHESAAVSTKAESTTVITEAAEKSTDLDLKQKVRNDSLAIEQKVHEDQEITSQSEDQTQYVSWDQIRPKPIRQHSSLRQEGGMEFNTTNRDEFIPRSVERVKGNRPKTNTKLFEGEFDATTMNQVMFSTQPGEKVTPFRPKSNLHLEDGSFNDETTSAREFQPWEVQRPVPIKPRSNLTQEGTMDFTTTNLTEFEGKMPEKVHPIRPTTTNKISGEIDLNTTNRVMHPEFPIERVKKIVPQSTLRMNSGVFESETTNKSQFQDWGIERPKPIKPVPNLTQEGSMDFTTMNNLQFHEKPIEKVQQFRPHTTTKITGEFDGTTMNQVMFQDSPREKVHAFRPQDNLKLEGGDFTNESTTKKEFQNWEYVKQSPIRHDSTMRQEGDIDFSTTNRREYVGKTAEEVALLKSQAYRPQNNLKVEGGDFTSETTNKKEFQQWEYVKPSPIKHDSSMRQEGDIDFSTTMRREYVGKTAEEIALLKSQAYRPQDNLKLEGGDFSSESTTKKEFQNWEYVKPAPIKHNSTMRQEGEIDFSTTSKSEFVGKTAEKVSPIKPVSSTKITGKFEGTTTNQAMFQDSPREKVHAVRPQNNLKVEEGNFASETTNRKEFQQWEYVKPSPIKPHSSMKQEGNIDFSTTNKREYVGKTAEEMALLKSQAYRPQDNLKLERGDFNSESTTKTEFQNWEYVKPSPIRQNSTMRQEGDIDFSTTTKREYVGKTAEEIALLKSRAYKPQDNLKLEGGDFANESITKTEYQNWEYVKPSPIKHDSTMRQEGDIDFSTTNKREFVGKTAEEIALLKSRAYRPQDNLRLEGGDFANESITKTEYQNWEYVKPSPIKHDSTMRQEGDIDFSTTNKREFVGKTAEEIALLKSRAYRPQDNLRLEGGDFANESITKTEYQNWEYVKPSPIKHDSTMKQEGEIDFSTTSRREYVEKTAEKVSPVKPVSSTKITGKFDGTTTNQAMFQDSPREKVKAFKPKDNLKLEGGDFADGSTTKTEFQNWEYVKPSPIKHNSTMRQEGDIDFSTTMSREYVGKTAEEIALLKSRAYKPHDNLKLEGGDFANESVTKKEYQNWEYVKPCAIKHESTMRQEGDIDFSTTMSREYVGKTAEEIALLKSRAYKPQDNLKLEGGDFANESVTKTEYQNWEYVKPSAIKHESTMRQKGDIDFSTTMSREYIGKTAEEIALLKSRAYKPKDNLKLEGGDFSNQSTTMTEFQNWEYVKQTPVKHDSTMKQEGDIDFSTTTRREYVGKTAEKVSPVKPVSSTKITGKFEGITTNQAMFQDSPREKVKAFKPQDNLKLEGGDFANESTTKKEFQNWEYVKQTPVRHDSSMRQEGDIDFSTTSRREYVEKTAEKVSPVKPASSTKITGKFDGITTNQAMYQDSPREKVKAFKPQDNLKLEGGDFANESTTKKEYQNWEYVKPSPIKHDSSMRQEGDIDFSTTTRREYVGKTAEEMALLKSQAYRPHDNLKLEGGDFANESITKTEYQNWEYVKPSTIKHESTMRQEGDIDFSTTNRREYVGKTAEEMALLKSQSFKPQDNLKLEGGDFTNESITKKEFQNWEYVKPSPIKHESTMRQEGDIDFSTTSRREYVEKTAEKVSPVKPVSSTKITGKFDGTTTNQAMFQDSPREKVKAFKPQDNLKLEGGDFADGSTTKAEFQNWEYIKAVPIKQDSTMRQEGEIDFSTTTRREYVGKTAEEIALLKSRAYKPQDNLKLEGGDFANESTTKKEFQNWEYVKPSPIKHDSTMKQEGDIDFSTTSRREYIGKTAEKVSPIKPVSSTKITGKFEGTTTNQATYQDSPREKVKAFKPQDNLKLEGGDFTSESTTKKEFQNWEYVKPSPIKHDSTMKQEGDIDFSTTTRREYIGKTAEEIALLKSRAYKPQDNLKLEGGDFSNQSTTMTEFQNWEYVKQTPVKHDSTMKQEGDIDFSTTTRREYVGKTAEKVSPVKPVSSTKVTGKFEGTTTNQAMFQDSPREKVKAFKPQDNLKLEGGDFANESTTKKEYQNWEYVKPSPIKHESTMKQEGVIDFSTTSKREFVGKTAEKVSPVKPVSSTKISGEFDGTTTNQAMFQAKKSVEKVKGKRPQTNIQLEKGKFEDETTARREFQQWEINKPKPIKPAGNLAQDGDMDFTTSNKTDFQPKSVPAVQPIRPKPSSPVSGEFDGTTTNKVMFQAQTAERVHDIRPKDNLRVDSGQFVGETTNSKEFSFKPGAKPEPIKPKSNLTQEGEFDFKTSNQTEFEKKQINKVSQIRPKTQTKTSDGKFYSTTTNQAMFQTPQMQNVQGIKPSDNLHVEKGKFQSNTTSTDEYQQWKGQKQKVNQLTSSIKQEGNMQFETTNKTEFKERGFDRVQQIRPKTTNKLIEGDFDSTTTNQVMFQQHGSVQRAKPIRHESNLRLEGGKFANETTNTREFRQWVKMENKDSQNKKKIEAAGVRSQKEKSETKKDSGAQNIKVTGDKDQHEPWKLNKETGETIVKETKTVSGQSEIRLADDKTKTQSESQQLKRSEEMTQVVKSKVEVSKSDISMQKQEIETRTSQTTQRTNGERQHRVREISSVTTDSGGKPSSQVKSIVPAGNLSSEGNMSFATTSQTDFSRQTATMSKSESKQMSSSVKEVSEMRSQKSVGNVKTRTSTGGNLFGEGDMSFVTTSKTDFSPQKVSGESKQMSSTPKGTVSKQSKVAVENEMALNATLSRRSVSKESLSKGMSSRDNSMSPQKTPTKTKRFRPEDNLKIESVPFDATSTTRTEFQKWETRRSSSKKRNESLKQEGSMEFNVTSNDYSQAEYQANRDHIKAKSKADQRGSLGQSGAMEFHTTSNSSYTVHAAGSYGTKSKTVRPRTSLKLGSEDATSRQDAMSSSRSNPEVSSSELVSTSRAAYVSHTPSRRSVANRPPTNQKIGEGSFESQTTTRSSFTVHQGQVEKPRIVKHESHNILNTENGFTGKTTYRNSFETVRTHHCPVLDLEAGRSALSFNEEKNGHLFYAPNVEMNMA